MESSKWRPYLIGLMLTGLIVFSSCDKKDFGFQASTVVYYPRLEPQLIFEFLPQAVSENSAIIREGAYLWTLNDSGHGNILYQLDPTTGTISRRLRLTGARNIDWEGLTQDSSYVYVGDFGNNGGWRFKYQIYRIPKFVLQDSTVEFYPPEVIEYQYEDYPKSLNPFFHNFDCEAFVSAGDSLYMFTKNRANEQTNLYVIPASPGSWEAKRVGLFDSQGQITAASLSAQGTQLALLGYRYHPKWKTRIPFVWIMKDYPGNKFFSGKIRRWDLELRKQTEGISWINTDSTRWWISAEKGNSLAPTLFEVQLPKDTAP